MRIRRGQPDDLPALQDLWVAAWTRAMPFIDFEARRAWLADHLKALEASGTELWVGEEIDRPAGLITIDPQSGLIDQLVVGMDHQGHGLATLLIEAAQQRTTVTLNLSVNADNARAVAFYKREGFAVTGSGTNPRSGLPVLVMRRVPPAV